MTLQAIYRPNRIGGVAVFRAHRGAVEETAVSGGRGRQRPFVGWLPEVFPSEDEDEMLKMLILAVAAGALDG